ncbi:flavin-containing monooxygenase [Kutzneria sp. NPDC052558]|uniref:flavin-containing monooxygenase n=1 Tax=Kutzneria sp. NPDC052558 TaxID=3364121 RepID=UPI0037CB8B89
MSDSIRSRFTHNVEKSVVHGDVLRRRLDAAETVNLLLSAVHVTGDTTLLDRYGDRVGRLSMYGPGPESPAEPTASPEVRAELIDLLCATLSTDDQPDYLHPSPELFTRMARVATGQELSDRYVRMGMEQAGFVPDQRAVPPTTTPPRTLNLAIIGAGMTGIDAAIKASDRGFDFEVYDKASGVGGLWWSQTYPGVAVDTPSIYYSLSYELRPDWSKFFPVGDEYRSYLTELAKKYDLAGHLRFNSEVIRLEWLEADQVWELTILDTEEHTTRTVRAAAVITAAGHLNRPKYPDVDGRESFRGESIHTSLWRDVDLRGKRVAVVGVGAAGIQVVGSIAGEVEHLTVFQRQPHWVVPNRLGDGTVSDSERWLRRHLPYYLHWSRFSQLYLMSETSYRMNLVDEEWMAAHPTSISPSNEAFRQEALNYIHDCFGRDSELARKLTPNFTFGGKRPIRDPGEFAPGGFYWALAQPHVDLVTEPMARVVPDGIVTADGAVTELDVIIWASGMTLDWLSPIDIVGRGGVRLSRVWADQNPRTYLGGTVPGFPNLFVHDGPNTGVATGGGGHNFMTETVDHYVFECLQLLVENGGGAIEVTQAAHDEHNDTIEREMSKLVWTRERRANTYYRNQAGRIILPSPFRAEDFWDMCQKPDRSKFILSAPRTAAVD